MFLNDDRVQGVGVQDGRYNITEQRLTELQKELLAS